MLKYIPKSFNSCCFISLVSAFDSIKQTKAVNDISLCVEESFKSKVGNRINSSNAILKNEKIIKGEPRVNYSMRIYKDGI